LAGWAIIEPPAAIAFSHNEIAAGQARAVVPAKNGMAPCSAGFTTCFPCLGKSISDGDSTGLVSADRDGFDARSPMFDGLVVQVARSVVGMDARSMKNFRAQVVSKSSEAPLVDHQSRPFFPRDRFAAKVLSQHEAIHFLVQNIRAQSSQKWMTVFFRCGQENDVGGRPQADGMLVGEKFSPQRAI